MSKKGSLLGAKKKRKPSFVKTPMGAMITLLLLEAIAYGAWSYLGPKAEETVSLELHTQLQGQLAAEQTTVQDLRNKLKSNDTRYQSLQKKNQKLTREVDVAIRLDELPQQVKGKHSAEVIEKITTLCKESQDVNRINVGALLTVLREIQQQDVINASLEAQEETRQSLYKKIQVVLHAIDSYSGPITNEQGKTLQAVKDFQAQNGLKVDGKIGLKTFMRIVEQFEVRRLGSGNDNKQAQQVPLRGVRNTMHLPVVTPQG
jgi:murein L,D-transpeptidase YcbB/YkuD